MTTRECTSEGQLLSLPVFTLILPPSCLIARHSGTAIPSVERACVSMRETVQCCAISFRPLGTIRLFFANATYELSFYINKMPTPRRPLGEIDGKARRGIELSPFDRGQIIATRREGGSWNYIADKFKIARSTIRSTVSANPLRTQGHSLKRSGRPPKWNVRDERRILKYARANPKHTWAEIMTALALPFSKRTYQRIVKKHHITK